MYLEPQPKKESDKMRIGNKRKFIMLLFGVYMIGVLSLTFIVRETMVLRTPENRGVILEPFREIQAMIDGPKRFFWFMQIFLNVLLFVPFGFLLPMVQKRFNNVFAVTLLGFIFSCGIESMQYITGRGLTEIDDIINNTAGAFCGYLLYAVLSAVYQQLKEY